MPPKPSSARARSSSPAKKASVVLILPPPATLRDVFPRRPTCEPLTRITPRVQLLVQQRDFNTKPMLLTVSLESSLQSVKQRIAATLHNSAVFWSDIAAWGIASGRRAAEEAAREKSVSGSNAALSLLEQDVAGAEIIVASKSLASSTQKRIISSSAQPYYMSRLQDLYSFDFKWVKQQVASLHPTTFTFPLENDKRLIDYFPAVQSEITQMKLLRQQQLHNQQQQLPLPSPPPLSLTIPLLYEVNLPYFALERGRERAKPFDRISPTGPDFRILGISTTIEPRIDKSLNIPTRGMVPRARSAPPTTRIRPSSPSILSTQQVLSSLVPTVNTSALTTEGHALLTTLETITESQKNNLQIPVITESLSSTSPTNDTNATTIALSNLQESHSNTSASPPLPADLNSDPLLLYNLKSYAEVTGSQSRPRSSSTRTSQNITTLSMLGKSTVATANNSPNRNQRLHREVNA